MSEPHLRMRCGECRRRWGWYFPDLLRGRGLRCPYCGGRGSIVRRRPRGRAVP